MKSSFLGVLKTQTDCWVLLSSVPISPNSCFRFESYALRIELSLIFFLILDIAGLHLNLSNVVHL